MLDEQGEPLSIEDYLAFDDDRGEDLRYGD